MTANTNDQSANTDSGQVLAYVKSCRRSAHLPTNHHGGNAKCDCPCHLGSKANPWWTERKDSVYG